MVMASGRRVPDAADTGLSIGVPGNQLASRLSIGALGPDGQLGVLLHADAVLRSQPRAVAEDKVGVAPDVYALRVGHVSDYGIPAVAEVIIATARELVALHRALLLALGVYVLQVHMISFIPVIVRKLAVVLQAIVRFRLRGFVRVDQIL